MRLQGKRLLVTGVLNTVCALWSDWLPAVTAEVAR